MSDPNIAGEWLSLTEAALRLGTTPDALRQRIKRGRIEASRGNDNRLRVWVPTGTATEHPNRTLSEAPNRSRSDRPVETSGQGKGLEPLVEVLREQLRAAEQREAAERGRAEAAEARERTLQADRIAAAEAARAQAADLAARLDHAQQARLADAERHRAEIEALRAELATEQGRRWWRRLRR